jgi:hypothetical protein
MRKAAEADSAFIQSSLSGHLHNYRPDNGLWISVKRVNRVIRDPDIAASIGQAEWHDCIEEGEAITNAEMCTAGEQFSQ